MGKSAEISAHERRRLVLAYRAEHGVTYQEAAHAIFHTVKTEKEQDDGTPA